MPSSKTGSLQILSHQSNHIRLFVKPVVSPSFGTFTGGHPIRPAAKDRIFTPLNDRIVELPASYWK